MAKIDFSAGAGFRSPTGSAGNSLDTGWKVDFRGGYNVSSHFAADLDVSDNRWDLNLRGLATVGEPGGHVGVWMFAFQPVVRVLPRRSPAHA